MQHYRLARFIGSVRWLFLIALFAVVGHAQSRPAATKVITGKDNGAEIHLRTGDPLEVRLKSNPSTGYMWYVQETSTPLLELIQQSQTKPTKPGVGRPVFQVFKFAAGRGGDGNLQLHYVRSWEPPTAQEDRFEIHVFIE